MGRKPLTLSVFPFTVNLLNPRNTKMKIRFVPNLEVLDERLPPGNLGTLMPDDIVQVLPNEEIKNKHLLLSSPLDDSEIEIGVRKPTTTEQYHESLISKYSIESMTCLLTVRQYETSSTMRLERFESAFDQKGHSYPETSSTSIAQSGIAANSNAQELYEAISSVGEITRNSFVILNTQSIDDVDSLALWVNQKTIGDTESDSDNPDSTSPSYVINNGSEMGASGCDCHGHVMQLNSVAFTGDDRTDVYRDLGSQAAYVSPQWLDANHDDLDDRTITDPVNSYPGQGKGYPISYARNSAMQATVSVNLI